jgi:hypothetical protein
MAEAAVMQTAFTDRQESRTGVAVYRFNQPATGGLNKKLRLPVDIKTSLYRGTFSS